MEWTGVFSTLYYAIIGEHAHKVQSFSYWKHIGIACAVLVVAAGAVGSYRWYVVHREKSAHTIFVECLDQYERAEAGDGAVTWSMVRDMWRRGYEQHRNSHLAPYFLAYEADACLKDNKPQEALPLLQQVCVTMPHSAPLYGLYCLKAILLESSMTGMTGEIRDRLQTLADDTHNKNRDQALYYLGLSYWTDNDLDNAAQAWHQLMTLSARDDIQSPWAQLVENKYQQLVDSGYPRSASAEQALFAGVMADQATTPVDAETTQA